MNTSEKITYVLIYVYLVFDLVCFRLYCLYNIVIIVDTGLLLNQRSC